MAKHQDPHGEPADRGHRRDDDDEKQRRHRHEHERGPRAEREIFVDLVQRRMGGGAHPSTEAYAKAMQQWQQLPGALTFTAVPVFPEREPKGGAGDGKKPAEEKSGGDNER